MCVSISHLIYPIILLTKKSKILHYFQYLTYLRHFCKVFHKSFVNFTSESFHTSLLLLAFLPIVQVSIVCALEYGPALFDTSQFFGVPAFAGVTAAVGDIAFAGIEIAVAKLVAF
jgi:hypothetical protein